MQRRELMIAIAPDLNPFLKLWLNGDLNLSQEINSIKCLKVHKYIIDTYSYRT